MDVWFGFIVFVILFLLWVRARHVRSLRATEPALQITGFMHVNINCRDFDQSKAFYEALGFRQIMRVAEVGNEDVAAAVGLPPYQVRGALLAHKDGSTIDLLQWVSPGNNAPPYESLNHVGLARLALHTMNIEADVNRLMQMGVEFLSEPVKVAGPAGTFSTFVCFKDPDGTVLELIETDPAMRFLRATTGKLGRFAVKQKLNKQSKHR